MSIKMLKPGLTTSVQDTGHEGHCHLDTPPPGALDQYTPHMTNLLVGSAPIAATSECALLDPQLESQCDAPVAVCGARMTPRLEDAEMPLDTPFWIRAGQVLGFGFIRAGTRGYLVIGGDIAVPEVLDGRSAYGLGVIGSLQGQRLAEGDPLPLEPVSPSAVEGLALLHSLRVKVSGKMSLRAVPGFYIHRLTPDAVEHLFAEAWTISSEADRTGYCLKGGTVLRFEPREQPFGADSDPFNVVNACRPTGSVQVSSGLEPIVLHCDAVSGGGYATLGTVAGLGLNRLAQVQPNWKVRFVAAGLEEGFRARRHHNWQV